MQDPEVARIYFNGIADRDSLSEADLQRFDPLLQIQIFGHQQNFRLARDGIISPEAWADIEHTMRWGAQRRGIRQWWILWQSTLGGDFREYYDGLIREGEAAG